jgi:RimJ/RimL family protein N-acetyltransferase
VSTHRRPELAVVHLVVYAAAMLLETPRLILRELEEADAPAAHIWESDPEVVRYQSTDSSSLDETVEYLRRVRRRGAEEPRRFYELGAERREDRLLIGRVGLRVARPEHREAEIWFAFRRDVWGLGHGTEAVRALIDFGFSRVGLHRIYGDCDPRNARSARLMERLGMRRDGHLRENWWLKGEWCDSWIYSILDREWPAATGQGATSTTASRLSGP